MSRFDRFANAFSTFVSRAPFFCFCVVLIIVWAPTIAFMPLDTWQLVINTITTIITFLLVAVLQNSSERFENTTNKKLNALLRWALWSVTADTNLPGHTKTQLVDELLDAIGSEEDTGT
jgi:low affinity Fe/Cu permease